MVKFNSIETSEENKNNKKDTIFEDFQAITDSLICVKGQITILQQQIKNLEKNIKKKMDGLNKVNLKNKLKGNRSPSGFAKPTKVSKELCEFMNKKEGSEIARTDVTRALVTYIKENKLENTENSKFILPDDKLKALLSVDDGDELTYFTIQKYMNKHFTKEISEKEAST